LTWTTIWKRWSGSRERWREPQLWSNGAQGRWPASYDRYWEVLKRREGKQAGTRAMIEVLLLGQQYGAARLRQAIEEALEVGCSDAAAVRYLLTADALKKTKPDAVELGALISYERPQPTMAGYDQLLLNAPVGEVIQ
jgi:hypothetical protein